MTEPEPDPALVGAARAARRVVVFSGAGMSAESGVPTFRDAQTGLWERFEPAELATPRRGTATAAWCGRGTSGGPDSRGVCNRTPVTARSPSGPGAPG
ncbi:hypothetical protein J2X34_003080 [Rhodococcus sp. BE178]